MYDEYSCVNISRPRKNPTFHKSRRRGYRFLAAEIEIAKSDPDKAHLINQALYNWDAIAVRDGSLPIKGYEINTAPAKAEKFENQIGEICAALSEANAEVTRSCGLHIHVDARDLKILDIKRVMQTYLPCEKDLFSMLAHSRKTNSYCEPMTSVHVNERFALNVHRVLRLKEKARPWRKELVDIMYPYPRDYLGNIITRYGRPYRDKYNSNRYYALNVHSWFYRKTLEFRHHQGTANAFKIVAWAKICESIVNFGVNHTEEEIENHFNNNLEPLASILPSNLKEYFLERRKYFKNNRTDKKKTGAA
jgi:hypothetical protein